MVEPINPLNPQTASLFWHTYLLPAYPTNFSSARDMQQAKLWTVIVWSIWKHHNLKLWNNVTKMNLQIFARAKHMCIRDDEGRFVLAKTMWSTPICEVDVGEALGLLCAINWVHELQLEGVDFVMDSKKEKLTL
ncbi:unnamed protein product [Trifolium pratense]|uniref:Uncharacterized protein n=1 Tax=Trifolium pratense TaxID=57577 RepID=A0ACB0JCY4_TRIPR|nr:unnamed protein product [Trifolium pratense]